MRPIEERHKSAIFYRRQYFWVPKTWPSKISIRHLSLIVSDVAVLSSMFYSIDSGQGDNQSRVIDLTN